MRHEPCYFCLEATPIHELDGNGCCWSCSPENPDNYEDDKKEEAKDGNHIQRIQTGDRSRQLS